MNALMNNFSCLLNNKHVGVPVALAIGLNIAQIWLPERFHDKLEKTEHVLMAYGMLAAANSGPKQQDISQQKATTDEKTSS